ncbi:MAG: hypothetical protein SA176_11235 [Edaphobacter sp.]|uniref:hypothetical protein n=1 Tax=Edaphobacter sp. TaxID=1934404 RepID=UPI002981F1CC|nr:hypothetical protein [Edaphobacter sp.]MDW5266319.1 hypothetical protein [Edaphobacter sp.]
MSEVTLAQLRQRLAQAEEKRAYLERKGQTPPGLARYEMWQQEYLTHPYVIGAPADRAAKRFADVFINVAELGSNGLIGVHDFKKDPSFTVKLTHMIEEFGLRGGVPPDVIEAARAPALRYFEKGDPIAVQIFVGYRAPASPFVVKYGQRRFLEPMLREGRLRICPASFYNDPALLASVQDDEITRHFFIPTYRERLAGQDSIVFDGHRLSFGNDDIVVPIVCRDYFLFSLCDHIYYRMPTDFDADAALIIRDPGLFAQRVISHFLALHPEWDPIYGPVTYYDPYLDYRKFGEPEMMKSFGYSYQREVRIVFRSKRPVVPSLAPVFLKIGSMTDYAELVFA